MASPFSSLPTLLGQCFLFLFAYNNLSGNCNATTDGVGQLKDFTCEIRLEMAALLRQERDCDMWRFLNPICSRDVVVSYSTIAPYIFEEDKKVVGLLPGRRGSYFHIKILTTVM